MSTNQPTAKDEEMMEKVLVEAHAAIANGRVGVASLLVWHDEILTLTPNLYVETGDVTAHAEMVVLRVKRKEGRELLARMGKLAMHKC